MKQKDFLPEISNYSVNEEGVLVLRSQVSSATFNYTCDYEVTGVDSSGHFHIKPFTKRKL